MDPIDVLAQKILLYIKLSIIYFQYNSHPGIKYSIIRIAVPSSDNFSSNLVAQINITAHTAPLFSEKIQIYCNNQINVVITLCHKILNYSIFSNIL